MVLCPCIRATLHAEMERQRVYRSHRADPVSPENLTVFVLVTTRGASSLHPISSIIQACEEGIGRGASSSGTTEGRCCKAATFLGREEGLGRRRDVSMGQQEEKGRRHVIRSRCVQRVGGVAWSATSDRRVVRLNSDFVALPFHLQALGTRLVCGRGLWRSPCPRSSARSPRSCRRW